MHQSFSKLSPLNIVSLVTFTIFDKLVSFYCFGLQIPRTTFDNDTPPMKDNQQQKLYVVTLTSNYVVTMTSTSYSYSSLTTTLTGLPSSSTIGPDNTALIPSSSSSSHPTSSSTDTSILIGSLVGGISGILLIGICIFLFIRRKDRTNHLPPSSSSFYIDPQDDGGAGGIKRTHYGRAFVPPLTDAYHPDLSLSSPTVSTDTAHQHHHGYPYSHSDGLIHSYYQQNDVVNDNITQDTNTRHVPDEVDQQLGAQRHVPHLVD
ncbi:hypothetical protein BC941DRAFT_421696 [Chlamydoabsidia padenii]|nr:hypothetical protein BC941DRAFT_421696 [Chlamydoabsidia padenii]